MSTFEHIKTRIVTIAEQTRPYLKKARTIGCAAAVKFADWCEKTYHWGKPHVIAGWKNLLPYLKRAWQIGGIAAEKVADWGRETYRRAKPHVITGLENLRQWFAGLSPRGKNAVMIVSAVFFVGLIGMAVAQMFGNGVPQENTAAVAESSAQGANQPKDDKEVIEIAKKDVKNAPFGYGKDGKESVKKYLEPRKNNYDAWKKAAEVNNPEGQILLGLCNYCECITPSDPSKAVQWFHKAAEQGNAEAQVWIGVAYLCGKIVAQNEKEAMKWFRKAAEQGFAYAQIMLASCYGKGVVIEFSRERDEKEAVRWYCKAAEQGSTTAQILLGEGLSRGMGIKENIDEKMVIMWIRKAAEHGDEEAINVLQMIEQIKKEDPRLIASVQLIVDLYENSGVINERAIEVLKMIEKIKKEGLDGNVMKIIQHYPFIHLWRNHPEARGMSNEAIEMSNNLAYVYHMEDVIVELIQNYEKIKNEQRVPTNNSSQDGASVAAERAVQNDQPKDGNDDITIAKKDVKGIPVTEDSEKINDYLKERKKNYDAWKRAAESGNPEGQVLLGLCNYFFTDIIPSDSAKAVMWFRKAVGQENATAQSYLGECYLWGTGVEKDETLGFNLLQKAANQKDANAQYILANSLETFKGGDQPEAVKWYREAANQGHVSAIYSLGTRYMYGRGIHKDESEAVKWYRKAAEKGEARAMHDLSKCYMNGTGIRKDEIEAITWLRKAAEQEELEAQIELASRYYEGRGVPKNLAEAFVWFQKLAEQGNAGAQVVLGDCYGFGDGVEKNEREAFVWYQKAAEQNFVLGQYALGNCYYSGRGVSIDYEQAVKWYRKAAEQNHVIAQVRLGLCLSVGRGVTQNKNESIKWFRKAAEQGDETAIQFLREQGIE